MYVPKPLNTESIKLSEDLLELSERLAENTHDCWARQKMQDGWRYGPVQDHSEKLHPCLVPYDELTEDQKEYDRITSLETLKMICALGYRIERNPNDPA